VVALVAGIVVVLIGIGLLAGGGIALWADRTQRDADGFLSTDFHRYASPTYALTVERIDLRAHGPHWLYPRGLLGTIRIRAQPAGKPLFIGVARSADAARYLSGVAHTRLTEFGTGFSDRARGRSVPGGPPAGPPLDQGFWYVTSSGPGTRTLTWPVRSGSWTFVLMNADASAGVDVRANVGAKVPALLWIAIGLLIAGALVIAVGALLVWIGTRRPSPVGSVPPPPPPPRAA
jgi:hypothetical protein